MNRERLKLVRDRIAAEPEHVGMPNWKCDTVLRIGGWASVIATGDEGGAAWWGHDPAKWLGLSDAQAGSLFYPSDMGARTKTDALAALDSFIGSERDDALAVWSVKP